MEKKSYLSQYHDKRWYELSKRIKARDKNTCQMCGHNDRPVSVHHKIYHTENKIWEYTDDELICICDKCHNILTDVGRDLYDDFKNTRQKLRELGFSDNVLSGIFNSIICVVESVIEEMK